MNDNNIVPSDEELALFAKAGQEVIDRLKARIREQATEWRGIDKDIIYPTNNEPLSVAQKQACPFCNNKSSGCVRCDFTGHLITWVNEPITPERVEKAFRRYRTQQNLQGNE